MKIVNKAIDWLEDNLLMILMFVMPIVIFLQIVLRVTGQPLKWTEETARYMYIWVIYVGCSRGVRNHNMLSVNVLQNLLKEGGRARAIFDMVTLLLCLLFTGVFVRYSVAMIQNLIAHPKYSPACQYNMIIVYLSTVVASVLMLIRYLQDLVQMIQNIIHPQKVDIENGGDAK
jgi:TRAP-type C4-dicarboxylate transport system permease small subunit